jgi:PST family polysaccharide transporter
MILWQVGNYAIPLLTFPYLTRILGLRQFGVYALSFAVASYFVLLTDWGFALAAPGQIARTGGDRSQINRIFWSTLSAKAILGCVAFVLIGLAAFAFRQVREIAPVLFCASGMVVANVITVNWCLQGLERLGKFATAATIGRALTVPATILLVHSENDAWIAALVQSAGAGIGGVISLILLRNLSVVGRPVVTVQGISAQIKEGWPLFVSALSATLYTSTNTVVLGMLRGPAQAGLFGGADRLRMAAQAATAPISSAVFPRSSRLMHEDRDAGLAFARRLLLYQGAFMLLISIVMMVAAEPMIRILAGPHFEGSVAVLRCLAPIPFLVGIGNVFGVQLLLPLGMKRTFSRITAAAAVIDIAIVFPLSWWFGAVGTAFAALVAEGFVVAAMGVALARTGLPIFRAPVMS